LGGSEILAQSLQGRITDSQKHNILCFLYWTKNLFFNAILPVPETVFLRIYASSGHRPESIALLYQTQGIHHRPLKNGFLAPISQAGKTRLNT